MGIEALESESLVVLLGAASTEDVALSAENRCWWNGDSSGWPLVTNAAPALPPRGVCGVKCGAQSLRGTSVACLEGSPGAPGDKAALGGSGQQQRHWECGRCVIVSRLAVLITREQQVCRAESLIPGNIQGAAKTPGVCVWVGPVTVAVSLCKLNCGSRCKRLWQQRDQMRC